MKVRVIIYALLAVVLFFLSTYYIPYIRDLSQGQPTVLVNIIIMTLQLGTSGVFVIASVYELMKDEILPKNNPNDVILDKISETIGKLEAFNEQRDVEPIVKNNSQDAVHDYFLIALKEAIKESFKQGGLQLKVRADGKTNVDINGLMFEITGTGKQIEVEEKHEEEKEVFEVEGEE